MIETSGWKIYSSLETAHMDIKIAKDVEFETTGQLKFRR